MFNEYEDELQTQMCCVIEIKFDVFMKIALSLGADYVATGHYCRKSQTEVNGSTVYQLRAGNNKDQSYFLCQLSQEQLSKSLFPIGELTKPEVREIAAQMELVTAEKGLSRAVLYR
jgi:tRNA-specific 2-thiouridylase